MNDNGKGYSIGSYADREIILRYMIHLLDKKIEEKPDGGIKKKGKQISYEDMRKELEVWVRVWFE